MVPQAVVFLEAFTRMLALDFGARDVSQCIYMISYVSQYIDADGLLDLEELPEPMRTFYVQFRQKNGMSLREKILQLKDALGIPLEDSHDD
jgi:hypothetical protein